MYSQSYGSAPYFIQKLKPLQTMRLQECDLHIVIEKRFEKSKVNMWFDT